MKAVIYDYKVDRRNDFHKALTDAGWECVSIAQVYDNDTKMLLDFPEGCRLILLHLRGEDDNKASCGNAKSWAFLTTKLIHTCVLSQTCLISYSGGGEECPEPQKFGEYVKAAKEKQCHWVYFNGVKGPEDLNLKEFAEVWRQPEQVPPLGLLRPDPRIGALKLLILGYQVAHEYGNANAIIRLSKANSTKARKWTESRDWWLPVLENDTSKSEKLVEVLNNNGDLQVFARKLTEYYSLPGEAKEFPKDIHMVLCPPIIKDDK